MKKITLLTFLISMSLVFTAYALPLLPLWEESPITYNDVTFTVTDRSNSIFDSYSGDYYGYQGGDYSGYYLGTIEGNTTPDLMEAAISYYLNEINKEDFGTIEIYKVERTSVGPDSGTDGPLGVSWIDTMYTGTWTWDATGFGLGFYAVKGGNEFSLYFVDPAQSEGEWTTRHLLTGGTQPAISHFSAAPTAIPVPEPGVLILLGAGLLGLAAYARKSIKK